MSSVTVLQTALPVTTTTKTSATTPSSSSTTPLGPFQAGSTAPLRKPAPINPLAQVCQNCGVDLTHSHLAEDSQRRITELEAQVKILTTKATAAVDKLADYEDELRRLKSTPQTPTSATETTPPDSSLTATRRPPTSQPAQPLPQDQQQQQQEQNTRSRNNRSPSPAPPSASTTPTPATSPPATTPAAAPPPEKPPPRPTTASRLTSLLPSASIRRTTSSSPLISPNTPNQPSLQALLTREQTLRLAAERRVTQTNSELEELSTQLFTEANEMVATERKARARLEERVVVLERSEREKAGRLEVLERRVGRVERVRGLLAQQQQQQGQQGQQMQQTSLAPAVTAAAAVAGVAGVAGGS